MMSDHPQIATLNDAMTQALYLTTDDIEANRNGVISDRQIARVQGQMRAVWMGVGCFALLTTVPLLLLIIVFSSPFLRLILAASIAFWLIGFLVQGRKIRAQHQIVQQDLLAGKASAIEGVLTKKNKGRSGLYFVVDDLRFPVPQNIYDAAPENERFIIYYLPQSQNFLSMETPSEPIVFIDENQTI
jgi:hypothetical protein